mmetsp:Transcript_55312/g.89448  ORF Transcript_55312/g.89448 Transcript_55312/m.89448 type:complete len:327 (+) Transcript_55312:59-1039(+)
MFQSQLQAWQLCIVLVFLTLGAFSSAVGLLLMKKSADTESDFPFYHRRLWFQGFLFLFVNATVIDLMIFSVTPLAVIAPFSGLTIVFSTLLAHFGYVTAKEDISASQWKAISAVCIGVFTISVSGPRASGEVSNGNIQELVFSRSFEALAVVSILGIVVSLAALLLYGGRDRDGKDGKDALSENYYVILLAYGSASCGAMSQLCLKVVSMELNPAKQADGANWDWNTFACGLAGLAVFAPLQLYMLNSTLVISPTSYAVPLYQTLLVLLSILAGGTFFKEFAAVSTDSFVVFIAGVVLALAGLERLTSAKSQNDVGENERLLRPEP